MGCLIKICPERHCKYWNSEHAKTCKKCGGNLMVTGIAWGIDYRDVNHRRRRERIGPNKGAAKQRLREVESATAEERHIRKSPDVKTTFQELAQWYLELPEVQAKRSYNRDRQSLNRLLPFFGDRLLKDITPALVEAYRQQRLSEPSGRRPYGPTKPATVNREIACFKTIFSKAVKNGKAERNPAQGVKPLKENNERDRVLTPAEFALLLAYCPGHIVPIVKLAYYSAMRQGEILGLTWGQVGLKDGFIRLNPEHTKTNEGRLVPLTRELLEMFKAMRADVGGIPLPGVKVFTYAGRSVGSIKTAFNGAVKGAGLEDFTFHDLRHTAINNWRLQGHDYFRIMAASGHKTMHVFKRYNTVSREELKALVGG